MDIFFFSNCPPRLRENILRRSKPKCEERGEEPGAQDFEKVYSEEVSNSWRELEKILSCCCGGHWITFQTIKMSFL